MLRPAIVFRQFSIGASNLYGVVRVGSLCGCGIASKTPQPSRVVCLHGSMPIVSKGIRPLVRSIGLHCLCDLKTSCVGQICHCSHRRRILRGLRIVYCFMHWSSGLDQFPRFNTVNFTSHILPLCFVGLIEALVLVRPTSASLGRLCPTTSRRPTSSSPPESVYSVRGCRVSRLR